MTHEQDEKRIKIAAEKQFDQIVYSGLGGVATVLLSIISGDWVLNGAGKEKCARWAERAGASLSAATGATRVKCTGFMHNCIVTTGLMMGGISMLLPIKKMEDNKPAIVRWLHDRKVAQCEAEGIAISPQEQINADAALQALEQVPKQTWGSILSGRVVGTTAVFATMGLIGTPLKQFSSHTAHVTANTLAPTTLRPAVRRFTDSGILDAAATAICTSTLYVWSHFLFPPKAKEKTELAEAPPQDAPTSPVLVAENSNNDAAPRHSNRVTSIKNYQQHALSVSGELNATPGL